MLIHDATVIENVLLPIGKLSKEPLEFHNKHFRFFAKSFSWESCNLGIFNWLLLSSDPLLSCLRQTPKKRTKLFLNNTLTILLSAYPFSDTRLLDLDSDESYSDENIYLSNK